VPVSLSLAVAPIGGIESERGSPKVAKRATKIARAPSCNLSYLSATFEANDRGPVHYSAWRSDVSRDRPPMNPFRAPTARAIVRIAPASALGV
jgi:hypothetical protein